METTFDTYRDRKDEVEEVPRKRIKKTTPLYGREKTRIRAVDQQARARPRKSLRKNGAKIWRKRNRPRSSPRTWQYAGKKKHRGFWGQGLNKSIINSYFHLKWSGYSHEGEKIEDTWHNKDPTLLKGFKC